MQSFFGISQAQAARSSHKIYTPKAGLKNTYVSAFVSYMINDRTSLSLIVNSDRLAGDAKLSPLSKKEPVRQVSLLQQPIISNDRWNWVLSHFFSQHPSKLTLEFQAN
jgi:outer membrane scaffolding protein for murein synthesis (MipA/OmpV family)